MCCFDLQRHDYGIEGMLKNNNEIMAKVLNKLEFLQSQIDTLFGLQLPVFQNVVNGDVSTKVDVFLASMSKVFSGAKQEELKGFAGWLQEQQLMEKSNLKSFDKCLESRDFNKIEAKILRFSDIQLSKP